MWWVVVVGVVVWWSSVLVGLEEETRSCRRIQEETVEMVEVVVMEETVEVVVVHVELC